MDFTRCFEDVELRRVRIEHDDALEALRRTTKRCVENIKLCRARANHSEAFEALQTRLTS